MAPERNLPGMIAELAKDVKDELLILALHGLALTRNIWDHSSRNPTRSLHDERQITTLGPRDEPHHQ